MSCRKTVTGTKVEANRKNSKRSTGPRTERGKQITRFNAVILGVFAKHAVIPVCDGDGGEKDVPSRFASRTVCQPYTQIGFP